MDYNYAIGKHSSIKEIYWCSYNKHKPLVDEHFIPAPLNYGKLWWNALQDSTGEFNEFKFFLSLIWEPFPADNFSDPQNNIYATSV